MLVGQQLGPFLIEKELGAGAMGAVYRGTYVKTGKKVAIKVMLPGAVGSDQAAARFEREATILKQFNHPNIVKIYAIGKTGGTRFYAMEYIEGESLDHVLARRGRFGWEEVVTLGQQLCSALQHAHEQGIVHRDLKPSNLMVLADGTLKLTDFGIAKDLDLLGLTGANCTVGTAAYMSPEQCKGDVNLNFKSDLYSLGIVFYELITGQKPFNAANAMDMFLQHVKGKFERPSRIVLDLPVWLDTLICQLLEKKPEKRPQDAAMVYAVLGSIREKVEEQRSAGIDAVRNRMMGGPGAAAATDLDDKDVTRTLLTGKGRKKKRKKGAFYNQLWFTISGSLALVLFTGFLLWVVFRPPAPEILFKQAERLMKSGKEGDPERAYDGPLAVFQRHYRGRTDEQAQQMKEWMDDVEVGRCQHRLDVYLRQLRKGREKMVESDSDIEQRAFKAVKDEESGNLSDAAKLWQEVQASEGKSPWGKLAQRRLTMFGRIDAQDQVFADLMNRMRQAGRELKSESPEQDDAFVAYRFQHFADLYDGTSDLAAAMAHNRDIKEKLRDDPSKRYWYLVAARKERELRDRAPAPEKTDAVRRTLLEQAIEAARALRTRSLLDTRLLCLNLVTLYEKEKSAEPYVAEAKKLAAEVTKNIKTD